MSLARYFRSTAAISVLAAAFAAPAMAGDQTGPDGSGMWGLRQQADCLTVDELSKAKTKQQRFLAGVFQRAKIALDPNDAENESLTICIDPDLSLKAGAPVAAKYDHDLDRLSFDPKFFSYDGSVVLAKHEYQHRQKGQKNINSSANVNATPIERIILNFAEEADARASTIAWAYEQKQAGNPRYMAAVQDVYYKPMTKAYQQSMILKPGDKVAAMRAAVNAFLDSPVIKDIYARGVIEGIKEDHEFNPLMPVQHVISDEVLGTLGEMERGGNYMDETLMARLRQSFTLQDYQRLDGHTIRGGQRVSAMQYK